MARRAAAAVGTVGALVAVAVVVQVTAGGGGSLGPPPAAAGDHLRPYASCDALLGAFRAELQRTAGPYGWDGGSGRTVPAMAASGSASDSAATAPAPEAVGVSGTGTNVQESGVDEPDVAKVAGGRLVTLTGGSLAVVSAEAQPRLLGRLALGSASYGADLLLAGDRALVIEPGVTAVRGEVASSSAGAPEAGAPDPGIVGPLPIPPNPGEPDATRTTVRLADLSDPAAPRWLGSWSVDGAYVSARLVDGLVRIVTTTRPRPEVASYPRRDSEAGRRAATEANRDAAGRLTLEQVLPQATRRDGAGQVSAQGRAVDCADVSFAEGADGTALTLVTTLKPQTGLTPLDTTGVAAPGELLYAAADRLVVATTRWGDKGGDITQLHTFDTSGPAGKVRYLASGSVPGHVLGRWALSWQHDVLRVATTSAGTIEPVGPATDSVGVSRGTSESSVTTLRESGSDLVRVGAVGGLGKGEQIKAVRYLDDLAIVVTFRQTDPLYVVDLADPGRPAVRGELEVTGFSSYLHPVGHGRLLGIGMNADARTGRTTGLQASVYDLSDLSAPALTSRVDLGNGYTPVAQESRAFGYDPVSGRAFLPVQAYDKRSGGGGAALALAVSATGTVTEVGRLALDDLPARVLLAGDVVLAVGSDRVVAAAPAGLVRTGAAALR
ncbi:MAG: hypothetical protein JWL64_941 [Frankiales bacterium]|nr:hypothetical protein [Frankiales bacterium]